MEHLLDVSASTEKGQKLSYWAINFNFDLNRLDINTNSQFLLRIQDPSSLANPPIVLTFMMLSVFFLISFGGARSHLSSPPQLSTTGANGPAVSPGYSNEYRNMSSRLFGSLQTSAQRTWADCICYKDAPIAILLSK